MLKEIINLPTDKHIAGVHCIPITEDGAIVMVWDRNEHVLTTIGGRLEENEDLDRALDREAYEEAGLLLDNLRIPFASWYWEGTDSYTIFYLVNVLKFVSLPLGFEKTGSVIFNFETAISMIDKIEGSQARIDLIKMAEKRYKEHYKL